MIQTTGVGASIRVNRPFFRRRQLSLQCGTNSSRMRQSLTGGAAGSGMRFTPAIAAQSVTMGWRAPVFFSYRAARV
jgi:hypothetical protein